MEAGEEAPEICMTDEKMVFRTLAENANQVLDEFHAHEVLHVAALIESLFEREIVEHPWTKRHLAEEADGILERLHRFYLEVANERD